MEIALFRYDGSEVVDQMISLVHPHREVQKYVSRITGITPKMLLRAPRFQEIAKRILELTEGAVLVGHNVDFDYRMLRQEFARLGYPLEMQTLDTIYLAEQLIPDLPSYGLDTVCAELGIYRAERHRAEDDARATLDLFKILQDKDRQKDISVLGQSVQENDRLKDKIQDLKRSVKYNKGLFYLHNAQGSILYIGNSENVKSALNRLFMADTEIARQLREEVQSVSTEAGSNWLVNRIKKIQETAQSQPRFNSEETLELAYGVFENTSPSAKRPMEVRTLKKEETVQALAQAESFQTALRALRMFTKARPVEERQRRLHLVLQLPGELILNAKGRQASEKVALVVRGGLLYGYSFYALNDQVSRQHALEKNLVKITEHREAFTELLKLGILSGEFKPLQA